jgi:hypothetical protein
MVEVERSIGKMIMQKADADRSEFFGRLDDYFERNRQ